MYENSTFAASIPRLWPVPWDYRFIVTANEIQVRNRLEETFTAALSPAIEEGRNGEWEGRGKSDRHVVSWKIVADAESERRPLRTPKSVETGRLEEEEEEGEKRGKG